jgi:hypothetical protein
MEAQPTVGRFVTTPVVEMCDMGIALGIGRVVII